MKTFASPAKSLASSNWALSAFNFSMYRTSLGEPRAREKRERERAKLKAACWRRIRIANYSSNVMSKNDTHQAVLDGLYIKSRSPKSGKYVMLETQAG